MENLGSKSKFLRSKKVLEIQGYLDKDVELSNQQKLSVKPSSNLPLTLLRVLYRNFLLKLPVNKLTFIANMFTGVFFRQGSPLQDHRICGNVKDFH